MKKHDEEAINDDGIQLMISDAVTGSFHKDVAMISLKSFSASIIFHLYH